MAVGLQRLTQRPMTSMASTLKAFRRSSSGEQITRTSQFRSSSSDKVAAFFFGSFQMHVGPQKQLLLLCPILPHAKARSLYFDSANACGLQAKSAFCGKVYIVVVSILLLSQSKGRREKVGRTVPWDSMVQDTAKLGEFHRRNHLTTMEIGMWCLSCTSTDEVLLT